MLIEVVVNASQIIPMIQATAKKVRLMCEHTYGRHVSNNGNCLNTYECGKCGVHFMVDSSD